MKRTFLTALLLICAALMYQSCDYVSNAVPSSPGSATTGNSSIVYRKVLIEDYTGHKCGNCPAAARELKKLDSIYSGKIVAMAVHAGFYANATPNSNPPYPTDLKSPAGTEYDNFFGNSLAGNPNGLVNRLGYGTSGFIRSWSSWGTDAYGFFSMPADFRLSISNSYTSSTNQLTTVVTTKAINARSGKYNLIIALTEDSIIAEQVDYSLPTGQQYIPDYRFDHVLRGTLTPTWGDEIINSSISAGDSVVTTISNYQLASNWKWKKCHVVAFVYDALSGSPTQYEVLQVEQADIE